MATIGTELTLFDVASRMDPGGGVATIAELLNTTNEILDDMPFVEGNLPTGHRYTRRSGIPTPTWRKFNQGVTPTKSGTTQEDTACGNLEAYSEVDKDLADLGGNTAAFLASESAAEIEGMAQEFASTLFYGDVTSAPEEFPGLTQYYKTYSGTATNIGSNIIKGGGSGSDNTSLWLIGWSPRTVFGIYPKGSQAGLSMENKGQVTAGDASTGYFEAYRSHFKWQAGVAVKDWRYAVRIPNIDISDLATFGASTDNSAALIRLMIQAVNKVPSLNGVRPVFYCNATVRSWLDIMACEKSNVQLGITEFGGRRITSFWGIPIRRCDAITNTESLVS